MSRQRLGTRLHRLVERVEHAEGLDGAAAPLAAAAKAIPSEGPVKEALSGSWLGHPFHPLATFLPIGFWFASGALDLTGARKGADRLVGLGVLSAAPAAIAGLSDWSDMTREGARRVGVVHAASNSTASAFFAASYVARRRGDRRLGHRLALIAHAALGLGGFLGSHLTYVRGVGVSRTTFEERVPDWAPVDGRAVRLIGDYAVGARCTHCGTELDAELRCPGDHSAFRPVDGAVVQGPATTPLPVYEVRRTGAAPEIRSPGGAPPEPVGSGAAAT